MRFLFVFVCGLSFVGIAVAQEPPALAPQNEPTKENIPSVADIIAASPEQEVVLPPVYTPSAQNCGCGTVAQTAYQQSQPGQQMTTPPSSPGTVLTTPATFPTYQTQTPASMNQPVYSNYASPAQTQYNTGYRYRRPLFNRLRFRRR